MIYTLTPNPALDLGGTVDKIVPNEKTYVYNETRYPGGNAINAARIMAKLHCPVTATGFLGGSTGDEVRYLLKREGVHPHFITISGHTRINLTVSSKDTHLQTRLSFPGPTIDGVARRMLFFFLGQLKATDILVVGGSLPKGFTTSDLKRVMCIAHRRQVPCIVDVPGRWLRDLVGERPLLIKPNLLEFQELVGKKVQSVATIVREARRLTRDVPLVCVSSVQGGALLVTPESCWFAQGPKLQVRSTVGAGDSMVGAMVSELWRRRVKYPVSLEWIEAQANEILRWGIAAACATLTTSGTELGTRSKIVYYYKRAKVTQLRGV